MEFTAYGHVTDTFTACDYIIPSQTLETPPLALFHTITVTIEETSNLLFVLYSFCH
jgi:hypothetical protein